MSFIEDLKTALFVCIVLAGGILAIFGAIVGIYTLCLHLDYEMDKTICTLKIDNKEVYKGRAFFININSIGENGNTKHVTIYNDKYHLHPIKHYVSDKVEVK